MSTTLPVGTQTKVSTLPDWLSVPDPPAPPVTRDARALLHLSYEQIFERVIEDVYRGHSLQSLVQGDPRIVSVEDFMRWVKRDPLRFNRFVEAQEGRTEFLAGEILEISDGLGAGTSADSNDIVQRDRLRIETRKWLMGAHNRKKYGESKQIEIAGSVSIVEALAQAQARVIEGEVVDVTPRLENRDE